MSNVCTLATTSPHPLIWPPQAENLALHGFEQARFLVIYFYPKDDTPGCTTETIGFNAQLAEFAAAGAAVIGVSRDGVASHEKFRSKHALSLTLIADTDSTLCHAFNVIQLKKNYGKEYLGLVRSTFIVDRTGKTLAEWRNVKVAGHVEAVLEKIKALA